MVVVNGHHRAVDDAGVEPDRSGSVREVELRCGAGHLEEADGASLGLPVIGRVLRVQACLDRMPHRPRRFGGQCLSVCDGQLQLHQIQPGGQLGDGMFDLEAGVHLQEEELTLRVGEELDSAGPGVSDRLGRQPGGDEQPLPHAGDTFNERRGSLLDDLLVAALDGAFPFADGPDRSVLVGHHLNLDMVTAGQVALAEHCWVTERRPRLALCCLYSGLQVGDIVDHPHTASAAAG